MTLPLYVNCAPAERSPRWPALSFPGILSDPLVRMLMWADRVDPSALERELSRIAAALPPPLPVTPRGCLPLACR